MTAAQIPEDTAAAVTDAIIQPRPGRPGRSHGHRHNDSVRARPRGTLQPDRGRISLEEAQAG